MLLYINNEISEFQNKEKFYKYLTGIKHVTFKWKKIRQTQEFYTQPNCYYLGSQRINISRHAIVLTWILSEKK